MARAHRNLLPLCVIGPLLLLSLGGCEALFQGVFSSEVAQTTASRDLSGVISAAAAPGFNLSVLSAGSRELVLLYSSEPFDSTLDHLVVLSSDLAVLNEYTMADVQALPGASPLRGSSAVSHLVDGRTVVGNLEATASSTGLQLIDTLSAPFNPVNVQLDGWTMVGPSAAPLTWTGFGVDSSSNLTWRVYSAGWSTVTPGSHPLRLTSLSSTRLCGAFSDPESTQHNVAMFVFSDSGSDTLTFVQVPKNPDLVNGLFGPPLLENPAYPVFQKSGLSSSEVYVTVDSIIGYDQHAQSWVRFSPSSPDTESRLHTGERPSSARTAFSFSGGWYCTWDPGSRTLRRVEQWW